MILFLIANILFKTNVKELESYIDLINTIYYKYK